MYIYIYLHLFISILLYLYLDCCIYIYMCIYVYIDIFAFIFIYLCLVMLQSRYVPLEHPLRLLDGGHRKAERSGAGHAAGAAAEEIRQDLALEHLGGQGHP